MATISVQDLQDLAVRCTTKFLTDGTPLDTLLAKEASDLGLNSEQLKRSVEATNTLAYLKTLEKAGSNRTPEFQVADYNEILKIAAVPELNATGTYSEPSPDDAWLSFLTNAHGQTKQASEQEVNPLSSYSEQELKSFIVKEASINSRVLEDLHVQAGVTVGRLLKLAKEISADPQAEYKLSSACDGVTFTKLARLVFGEDRIRKVGAEGLFPEQGLKKVAELRGILCEAESLNSEIQQRTLAQSQAEELISLEKQAFLGALFSAGRAAIKLGGKIAKPVLKPVVNATTKAGSKVSGAAGRYVGDKVGNVISAPFKATKNIVKNEFNKGVNAASQTGVGKAFGVKGGLPVNDAPKKALGRKIAMGAALGGAAMDASMYTPKVNPATGEGGDVWSKLNR